MKTSGIIRIIIALGVLSLALFGITFAYYYHSIEIDNDFTVAEAKVYMNEKFNPSDKWVPGEEKEKEVRFGNEGNTDALLRVKFAVKLQMSDGSEVTDNDILESFRLNFADTFSDDWELGSDGWYYYKKVLGTGQITDVTLKSVTVGSGISNDVHKITEDYSSAVFKVDIASEMIQASGADEAAIAQGWAMKPVVAGGNVTWQ